MTTPTPFPAGSLRPRRPAALRWLAAGWLCAAPALAMAQAFCASDGAPAPTALVERFISADCEACWGDAGAPPPRGALVLDWIVPGGLGDDAPLSAAATRDGLARLETLGRPVPGASATATSSLPVRRAGPGRLRVAHGLPLGGYLGTSIELKPMPKPTPDAGWSAWLVLVETIAAGSDGTPVERNLVRNALVQEWNPAQAAPAAEAKGAARRVARLFEARPMGIAPGAKPERLRVMGWVQDAQGRVFAAAQSRCKPEGGAVR